LHLKDRKGERRCRKTAARRRPEHAVGAGESPEEILQSMKKRKYNSRSIEYEYKHAGRSDVLTEMKKCVEYCRKALA